MGQNSGLLSSLTDWNSTLAGYADSISSGVVMPIALTVLALFMVLELYNFTQTIAMNGGSTAFTIQQVALVMLKITLCRWAVLHSTEILNAMFEVAATVTNGIAGYVGSGQVNTEVDIENAISALPGGIGNMPVAMELMVVSWMLRLVNIVINTIVAARFIELYVYNALRAISETPSVLSGINRIQRWSQSKPLYLVFIAFFVSIYSVLVKRQGVTSGINIRLDTRKVALLSPAPSIQARGNRCSQA
jgi:hypothetical protein